MWHTLVITLLTQPQIACTHLITAQSGRNKSVHVQLCASRAGFTNLASNKEEQLLGAETGSSHINCSHTQLRSQSGKHAARQVFQKRFCVNMPRQSLLCWHLPDHKTLHARITGTHAAVRHKLCMHEHGTKGEGGKQAGTHITHTVEVSVAISLAAP